MIRISEEDLAKIQSIELDMLLEVDRICRKYKIKYSLIGGTLLGAIRHKGFIPWDDDADIGMLRSDYEKFREKCKYELDKDKYYLQDDRNTKGYRWGYGKVRRKNTLFLRENQEHLDFGQEIFIDIFPLDYAPDNKLLRKIHMFYCFCIRKILWSPVGVKVEKKILKKWIYALLMKIPKKVVYGKYYHYVKTRKKTNTVRINLFPTRKPYGFPKYYFEELEQVTFEGYKFFGSKHYDAYLTMKYDDYMQLPPIAERKVHPVSKLKV